MEFKKRFGRDLQGKNLNDALADFQGDLETYLTKMINQSHAPLMIPRTTIELSHIQYNFAAVDRAAVLASMYLQNTATTTSATYVTAATYTGRGVLQKVVVGEFNSALTNAFSGSLRITIDGNILNESVPISRQTSMRVALGNFAVLSATSVDVSDDSIGFAFNSSCLIEIAASGSNTLTVGWKVALKNA